MIKKIEIEIETEASDKRIVAYLRRFLLDNFKAKSVLKIDGKDCLI